MSVKSKAVLAMWLDQSSETEVDWRYSHTVEHMPERMALPGFIGARRYHNLALSAQRYFILYEGEDLATFGSSLYLARLNAPDARTQRVRAATLGIVRGAADVIGSRGHGLAGFVATIRFTPLKHVHELQRCVDDMLDDIQAMPGVTSSSICLARAEVTAVETATSRIRQHEQAFSAMLLVEGILAEDLKNASPRMEKRLLEQVAERIDHSAVYHLSFALDHAPSSSASA